jgi:hypothetical protein
MELALAFDRSKPARPLVRPFPLDGLPEPIADLITLGWEIHMYCQHSGPAHIPDRDERITQSGTRIMEFVRRLEIVAHAAYGVVRLDSPAFEEWERRVKAVHDSCFEAVRHYNPHRINTDLTNAAAMEIRAFERAGSGFRVPVIRVSSLGDEHADSSPDTQKKARKAGRRGPRKSTEFFRFKVAIEKGVKRGLSMSAAALEFTNGDETKAQSLLRKLRRHKDLPE